MAEWMSECIESLRRFPFQICKTQASDATDFEKCYATQTASLCEVALNFKNLLSFRPVGRRHLRAIGIRDEDLTFWDGIVLLIRLVMNYPFDVESTSFRKESVMQTNPSIAGGGVGNHFPRRMHQTDDENGMQAGLFEGESHANFKCFQ